MEKKKMTLHNLTKELLIVDHVIVAKSLSEKIRGLMCRKSFPKSSAMFFHGCPSVHTFFMNFPIDVVFLDKNMVVTKVIEDLKPWRCTAPLQFKNRYCLEFYSNGISQKISKGDKLDVRA
jgi:hypothetical protein